MAGRSLSWHFVSLMQSTCGDDVDRNGRNFPFLFIIVFSPFTFQCQIVRVFAGFKGLALEAEAWLWLSAETAALEGLMYLY